MFRKGFAVLGLIFACFIFGSMAFPGGVVESTANGTAQIPTVESIGGWSSFPIFLLKIGGIMLGAILIVIVCAVLIRLKANNDARDAYGQKLDKPKRIEDSVMPQLEKIHKDPEFHQKIYKDAKPK